jgi:hypothetical protein
VRNTQKQQTPSHKLFKLALDEASQAVRLELHGTQSFLFLVLFCIFPVELVLYVPARERDERGRGVPEQKPRLQPRVTHWIASSLFRNKLQLAKISSLA